MALKLRSLLLAAACSWCTAWWPFSSESTADLGGSWAEFDPQGNRISQGAVVQSGTTITARFQGKDWTDAQGTVEGSKVTMFTMQGSFKDGTITWPNGWKWVFIGKNIAPAPPPAPPVEVAEGAPEIGGAGAASAATCSWKPLAWADNDEKATDCHGHTVGSHTQSKDSAECLESYANNATCKFVSFDASLSTCHCKHSCPTKVHKEATTSFRKIPAMAGISGKYIEADPQGAPGLRGVIVQEGSSLSATFPGQTWSPASGFMYGKSVSMFDGTLTGTYKSGAITWNNGWKWVFQGRADLESLSEDEVAATDAAGIHNDGWVSSRDQTPNIVQKPSELVSFPWRNGANTTCSVSEEDVRFYDEHGWVHLKQVLDPDALDLLLDEAQTICKKQLATRGVCQIEQLRWQVNRFRDFMFYSEMGCYAHKLIRGAGVRITTEALFGTKYNEKNPNFFSYHFHVDSMAGHKGLYHAFNSSTKGVSVWFPMHDVDPDNTGGSVYVIDEYTGDKVKHHCKYSECGGQITTSRSTALPKYDCTAECLKFLGPSYEQKRKTFKFKKGDAVFWHPEMPHATQPVRKRDFTRHSFTIRLVESEAEVCNVGGNCGDWMGCCSDLPLETGKIDNHCFPQIYPKVLDSEASAHYSSTPKHLMGDQSWVNIAHTIKRLPNCL